MKSKLVASIAIAMITMVAFSMLSVIPVRAVPNIYMQPSVNPPTKALGFKWNITVWVSGWAGDPVRGYQVMFKILNPAAGVVITRGFLPKGDPTYGASYIFVGHATLGPPAVVTPTYAQIGDTTLDTPAIPGPEPAILAIVELQIVGAPGKYQTLLTELNINNVDTYLLNDVPTEIPVTITDGIYTWAWVPPTTNPDVAVVLHDPGFPPIEAELVSPQSLVFKMYNLWDGQTFVADVVIQGLETGWAISGAAFTLSYDSTLSDFVTAVLDPAWTGTVDTTTPGIILVSATTAMSLSGDVKVLTVTLAIKNQQFVPPAPFGYKDINNLVLTDIVLQDTVGPIPVDEVLNAAVTVYAKATLVQPWFSVAPTPIHSGTDLAVGDQYGKQFTVDISINALQVEWKMVALQFRLVYDADLVKFVSATEGPYLGQFDNGLGTFFVAVNTVNDVLYGDNVAVGGMILPNPDGIWTIFAGGASTSDPLASGVVAHITFEYVGQDFIHTFNMPLTFKDFNVEPAEQTYFIDDAGTRIPEGVHQAGLVIIEPISTIGRRIDLWMQYPAPFGGQGLNQPADLVVPQQEIILTAKVTYNWWPVAQKKVTFNVYDNQGNLVAVLEATTGDDGHAVTSFRMPWPNVDPENLFGVWTVVASVSVAEVTVTDTLTFHYDYLVEVLSVVTDKVSYAHLQAVHVTVVYGSHAQQTYPVWMTATLQDNLGVPVSVAYSGLTIGGAVYCQLKVYPPGTLTLLVPYWAYAGAAQVRVDFLNESPMSGTHVAVTPEATANIYILPY